MQKGVIFLNRQKNVMIEGGQRFGESSVRGKYCAKETDSKGL